MDAAGTIDAPAPSILAHGTYDRHVLFAHLVAAVATMRFDPEVRRQILHAAQALCKVLDQCTGSTLQERWQAFEQRV